MDRAVGSRLDRFLPPVGADALEAAAQYPAAAGLADLAAIVWRRRWLLVACIGLVLALALALLAFAPARYTAQATVRIDNEPARILEGQDLAPVVALADTARHLNTQVRTVTSRSLAADVVDTLGLAGTSDFLRAMGEDNPATADRRDRAIAALTGGVAMQAEPDSRVAAIAFTSPDPRLSAKIANAYADRYVAHVARERSQAHAYARHALADQIAATQSRLVQIEQAALAFARQHRLVDVGMAAGSGEGAATAPGGAGSLTAARLVELNRARAAAQASRIAAEARWAMTVRTDPLHLPDAQANATVQALLARRAGLAADLAQLRARYRAGQPEVQEKAAELREVESRLAAGAESLAAASRAELLAARIAERGYVRATDKLSRESLAEQEQRLRLNLLLREAETQRRQLDSLMARLGQVQAASDLAVSTVILLDRASAGAPTGPSPSRVLLIALIAGLIVGLLATWLREALDDSLRDPADAARRLHLPLLAAIAGPSSADAEAALAATVAHSMAGSGNPVLLVAGCAGDDGAQATALALARGFVATGRKVLLVGADQQQHDEWPTAPGVWAVLRGEVPLAATVGQGEDGLCRLPAGPRPADALALLGSGRLAGLLGDLRDYHDLVVLHAPPAGTFADALLLACQADAALIAARTGRTTAAQVRAAAGRIEGAGGRVLGLVVTGGEGT